MRKAGDLSRVESDAALGVETPFVGGFKGPGRSMAGGGLDRAGNEGVVEVEGVDVAGRAQAIAVGVFAGDGVAKRFGDFADIEGAAAGGQHHVAQKAQAALFLGLNDQRNRAVFLPTLQRATVEVDLAIVRADPLAAGDGGGGRGEFGRLGFEGFCGRGRLRCRGGGAAGRK